MDMKKLKGAYHSQRHSATKVRGIEWQFTWETWLAWWGADIVNRGCRKGQLVMARKGDTGPYSPDNCVKYTPYENSIEALKGKTKSAEHVAKVAAAHKGNKRSSEACANISAACSTPEYREKQAAIHKGMKRSPEACARIAAGCKARDERKKAAQ